MAIADTITSMQNHTSNAYTMIGYGTDLTGTNKNLENLSTSIFNAFLEALRTPDTLFTNLPKKSGSGSVISLNDTANAPMRIELGVSELTQDATPTPSSPQDIHTISGSNKVVVCGKNLFDDSTLNNKWISVNGDIIDATGGNIITIKCNANEIYTLSANYESASANNIIVMAFYNSQNSLINRYVDNASAQLTITNTTTSNTAYIKVGHYINKPTSIQLEKNNQATAYEPYNGTNCSIDLSSKNLFDYANATYKDGYIKTDSGTETSSGISGYLTSYIPVKPNTQYTILGKFRSQSEGMRFYYYDSSKNWISRTSQYTTDSPYTITTPNNCYYLQFQYSITAYYASSVQIAEGNNTTYEPYYNIECGSIGNYENIPIRTSGKNVFNVDNFNTSYSGLTLYRNNNKLTLNGTANNLGSFNFYDNGIANYVQYIANATTIKLKAGTYTISLHNISGTQNDTYCNLLVCKKGASTPNDLLSYFSIKNNETSTSFTLNEESEIYIGVQWNSGKVFTNYSFDIQLEKNNQATSYEPYGNGTWYIKKNIGKAKLNIRANWALNSSPGLKGYTYTISNSLSVANTNEETLVKCNVFDSTSAKTELANQVENKCALISSNRLYVWLNSTTFPDATSVADYFENTDDYVMYPLPTPTYTPITGTLANQLENVYQKLLSYSGTTNISQVNNDLSFNLSVQAIEEL